MDRKTHQEIEQVRRNAGAVESQFIDDALDGQLDRRELLQRGALFGLSTSVIGTVLAALGEAPLAFAKTAGASAQGRLRAAISPVASFVEPHRTVDGGTAATFGGEFLIRATQTLQLAHELAVGWKPNADASRWTFKLRPHVKFQSGQDLSADDVIQTYKRLTDPATGSQAVSAFKNVLSPDGIEKVDGETVTFHLDNPTASFPYLTSSSTYQAIILPANYVIGTFTSKAQVTGAFKMTSYVPGVSASYDRSPTWWGGKVPLDGVDATFFADLSAIDNALLSGAIDLVNPNVISLSTDRALFGAPGIEIFAAHSAAHTEICMRTDTPPFNDVRVRQAIALTLDRPRIVNQLYGKYGVVGNDHPLAPVYPASVPIPQRKKNIAKAKALMAAAGHANGLDVTMTVGLSGVNPTLAQIVQSSVKAIGINMTLNVEPTSLFYAGSATSTPWLNDPMTMTLWGHRAVPDVLLTAALGTGGVWNAAHYASKAYDNLLQSFSGAIAIKDQRKYAKKLELLVQHDTPIIYVGFSDAIAAGTNKLRGYNIAPTGLHISKVSLRA